MAITTRSLAMQSLAQGKGYFMPITSVLGTTGTAGAAASGFFTVQLLEQKKLHCDLDILYLCFDISILKSCPQ